MQILQSGDHFSSIEAGMFFGEALSRARLQGTEKLSSHAVVQYKVKVVIRLKRVKHRYDERMIRGSEDFLRV